MTKLLITIDTEGDNAWACKGYENKTENARFLPRFQQLCDKYGFKPTYLTSYEMARDPFYVEFAKDALKRGCCEIGLHPHPWNQPPEYPVTSDDMFYHPCMVEYPPHIIREKVKIVTNILEQTFETKIYSHRAGRWKFNAVYADILFKCGYKVDCSVTPYEKWEKEKRPFSEPQAGEVDYTNFPSEPYFMDEHDIFRVGNRDFLEIPMTIIPHCGPILKRLYSALPGIYYKGIFRRIFGRPNKWFRPHRVYREMLKVASFKLRQESAYLMLMLHSSEFMPGANPIFRDEKEVDQLYADLDEIFQFLKQENVEGYTCFEFYNLFTQSLKRKN